MIHSVIIEFKKYVHNFYAVCEEIAYLDMLQSLAETSLANKYTEPNFGAFIKLENARHPMLDYLLITKPVANSVVSNT